MADEYDSPWKEALQRYFRPFLEFCFPAVEAEIDWSREVTSLEQELREVLRDADAGGNRVDHLAKVFLRDGSEQWILLHVEIQSQSDANLPARVYRCHARITDRYERPTATLRLLADESRTFHPSRFEAALFGCRILFEFPTCKALDFSLASLEESQNPIAVVLAAHREAQQTRHTHAQRAESKWRLIRGLYERGFTKADILELFCLIDWILKLPPELELELRRNLRQIEQQNCMPYITSIERFALAEGLEQGLEQGFERGILSTLKQVIVDTLQSRFGVAPIDLLDQVAALNDEAKLRIWLQATIAATDLDEVRSKFSRT